MSTPIVRSLRLCTLAFPALLFATDARAGVDVLDAKVVSRGAPGGAAFDAGVSWFAASASGRYQVFASAAANVVPGVNPDVNSQIYWRDAKTGATKLVSHDLAGGPADGYCSSPAVSDDGKRVAFTTLATNLGFDPGNNSQVCFADLETGTVRLCSKSTIGAPANNYCSSPSISGDGRFATFESNASNLKPLVPNGPQIFVYEAASDDLEIVSITSDDFFANDACTGARISRTGRYVAFLSVATNMPAAGASATYKVILRDRETATTELISQSADGTVTDAFCNSVAMTPSGRYVAFFSTSPGLVPGQFAPGFAGYVVDRKKHKIQRFEAQFDASVIEGPSVLTTSKNAQRLALSTSFLPGGAVIPQFHGHVYDRAKHHHLLLATTDEPSVNENEDVQNVWLRGNGKTVFFTSHDAAFDLLGSSAQQALDLKLGGL